MAKQMKTCSSDEYGIPFDEFAFLAQYYCHFEPYRAKNYRDFHTHFEAVTSDVKNQMVVHYSKKELGQQDSLAHFSPIGGYNKEEDQVLIMDVACGKYPSVWVKTKNLYHAMKTQSIEESGRSCGYFVLSNTNTRETKTSTPLKLKYKDCTRQCHSK